MPVHPIADWSGGQTENHIDGRPNAHRVMRNLIVDRNRKPLVRPGSQIHKASSFFDDNHISDLKVIKRMINSSGNTEEQALAAYLHRLELFGAASNGLYNGSTTPVEVLGPAPATHTPFIVDTLSGLAGHAVATWRDHIFVTPNDRGTLGNVNYSLKIVGNTAIRAGLPFLGTYDPASEAGSSGSLFTPFYVGPPQWSSATTYALNNHAWTISAQDHTVILWKSLQAGNTNRFPPDNPTWWTMAVTDVVTYFAHLMYEYTIGQVTFRDFGPVNFWTIYVDSTFGTTANTTWALAGGGNASIGIYTRGLEDQISDLNRLIPVTSTDLRVFLYRTERNGAEGLFEYQSKNSDFDTFSYTTLGNKLDTRLGVIEGELYEPPGRVYINGGRVNNGTPPAAKFLIEANDCIWYLNVKPIKLVPSSAPSPASGPSFKMESDGPYENRFYQSVQGDGDSVPDDFFGEIDIAITGAGAVDIYPIVFGRNKHYRIEGLRDTLGRGIHKARLISETVGTISHKSIVRDDKGHLYFCAEDGFYFTDGFKCYKISEHFNERYRLIARTNNIEFDAGLGLSTRTLDLIRGAFDPVSGRITWAATGENTDDDDANYVIFVHDPIHGIVNEEGMFTEWSGGDTSGDIDSSEIEGTYSEFGVSALDFNSTGELLRATSNGVIYRHRDVLFTDPWVSPSTNGKAIMWKWISGSYSMGNPILKKWCTLVNFVCRKITDTISFLPISVNDDNSDDETYLKHVDVDRASPSAKCFAGERYFRRNGLRALYKAIGAKASDKAILRKSDDYVTAAVNGTTNTVTVVGAPNAWTSVLYLAKIYFEFDGYVEGFVIESALSPASLTMTVLDPNATLQTGTWKWVIRGYRQNERWSAEVFTIEHTPYSESVPAYNKGADGNA